MNQLFHMSMQRFDALILENKRLPREEVVNTGIKEYITERRYADERELGGRGLKGSRVRQTIEFGILGIEGQSTRSGCSLRCLFGLVRFRWVRIASFRILLLLAVVMMSEVVR